MSDLIRLNEVWDSSLAPVASSNSTTSGSNSYLVEDYLQEGSNAPEVDGKIVLGKVKGPSFFGDGVSRNQRFYPRSLWEKQLAKPRIQERLANRTMLGQVGHADGPVRESDVSSGMVSHIITGLALKEDNQGIAEILLLNTPAGRNLYTLMKAGSRIKISTRAQGKFLEGKTHNGLPIVDPDSFILETLDFVLEPGFIETDPKLQESLKEVNKKLSMMESRMSNKKQPGEILENYKKEKIIMDFNEQLIDEARKSTKLYEGLFNEQKKLREEAEEAKKEAEKEAEEAKKELEECKKQLAAYKAIGEASQIAEDLKEYAELGFSSPVEARFVLEALKEEAEGAIDAEEVEDIKKDIEEACKLLAQYEELGTPEELKDIKDKAGELVDELDKKEKNEAVARLSKKYNLPEALVRKVVEASEDEEEAEEAIKESLEGMADPEIDDKKSGTDVEDFENDHELPNKVNDNDVEVEPNVVEEALDEMLNSSKAPSNILEGYKAGSIVKSMFS